MIEINLVLCARIQARIVWAEGKDKGALVKVMTAIRCKCHGQLGSSLAGAMVRQWFWSPNFETRVLSRKEGDSVWR